MKSLDVYKITARISHKIYLEDTTTRYIIADSYEDAVQHVEVDLKRCGWNIEEMTTRDITILDIRKDQCKYLSKGSGWQFV